MKQEIRTKEQSIVWQNQSHLAMSYFNSCGLCPSIFDLCRVTDVLMDYAMNGRTEQSVKKLEAVDKYLNELKTKQVEG